MLYWLARIFPKYIYFLKCSLPWRFWLMIHSIYWPICDGHYLWINQLNLKWCARQHDRLEALSSTLCSSDELGWWLCPLSVALADCAAAGGWLTARPCVTACTASPRKKKARRGAMARRVKDIKKTLGEKKTEGETEDGRGSFSWVFFACSAVTVHEMWQLWVWAVWCDWKAAALQLHPQTLKQAKRMNLH